MSPIFAVVAIGCVFAAPGVVVFVWMFAVGAWEPPDEEVAPGAGGASRRRAGLRRRRRRRRVWPVAARLAAVEGGHLPFCAIPSAAAAFVYATILAAPLAAVRGT